MTMTKSAVARFAKINYSRINKMYHKKVNEAWLTYAKRVAEKPYNTNHRDLLVDDDLKHAMIATIKMNW